ncbi:MAG: class I tRNA ligase family protein, partial [Anaerolineales bacterium]|nr:class I tRNA ligase family protein [Anaerolineales bacterium]
MFKPVADRINVTLLEEEAARIWKTQRVYQKLRLLRQDEPAFHIYQCPAVTSGKPGLQDTLASVHQDFWSRYKAMRGLCVIRHSGWNTHGLPVELQAESRLGITGKGQAEKYGIARFNDYCQQLALDSVQSRENLSERLNGREETEPAPTSHDERSVEAVWGLFKQAWERGLVYQDEGVMPYCPHCGTVLADYEIVRQAEPDGSAAAYVRLPLLEDPGTSILAWVGHAWSLPGNVAAAVNSDAEYVIIEHDLPASEAGGEGGMEKLIIARALVDQVFGDADVRVYETFKGSKLKGLKYRPLFQFLLVDKPAYRVILDDFSVAGPGGGIVLITPAFDAHHLQLARQNDLPMLTPIGKDGTFISEMRPWRGMFFKDAEAYIQQDLQERGLLYRAERHDQSIALCRGCNSPLLPYVRQVWYLRAQDGDWLLGRDRLWGTPLPIWQCIQCGHRLAIGSLEELSHLAGRNLAGMDIHRPMVDEVAFACPRCDGLMRRLPQVLDAGLDAAALSLLQSSGEAEPAYPADLVCESVEQSKAWFNALHILSSLFWEGAPYRHLISLPILIGDEENIAANHHQPLGDPWDIIHDHGADALRWVFLSACSSGDQARFSNELLFAARNDFVLPLWDTYAMLVNSAIQAGWSPNPTDVPSQGDLDPLDRWLSSRLSLLVSEMTTALEDYDSLRACSLLRVFVTDLSGWYVPLLRRRFVENSAAEHRSAAFSSLYQALVTLSQLLAPFLPFIADEIYQKLVRSFDLSARSSVHLTDWPVIDNAAIDLELNRRMALLQRLASQGKSARQAAGIALHQPLAGAVIALDSQEEATALHP